MCFHTNRNNYYIRILRQTVTQTYNYDGILTIHNFQLQCQCLSNAQAFALAVDDSIMVKIKIQTPSQSNQQITILHTQHVKQRLLSYYNHSSEAVLYVAAYTVYKGYPVRSLRTITTVVVRDLSLSQYASRHGTLKFMLYFHSLL